MYHVKYIPLNHLTHMSLVDSIEATAIDHFQSRQWLFK